MNISFLIPNADAFQRLRKVIKSLPIEKNAHLTLDRLKLAVTLNFEDVFARTLNHLISDYESNVVESKTAPWLFDYMLEITSDNELNVLTRLFPKNGSPGNIFYGPQIIRKSDDIFLMWDE